jgi:hypothetical protein
LCCVGFAHALQASTKRRGEEWSTTETREGHKSRVAKVVYARDKQQGERGVKGRDRGGNFVEATSFFLAGSLL